MSTRRLILAALACGLAILVAGALMLLKLAGNESNTVTVLAIGDSAEVSGVTVQAVSGGLSGVTVRMSVPASRLELDEISARWSAARGGQRVAPTEIPADAAACSELPPIPPGSSADCVLAFAPGTGTTYLRFTLDERTAVWLLSE